MTAETHDLDRAATTPIDARVLDAMEPWLREHWGNPSSRHRVGVRARRAVDDARATVARVTGADDGRVVFTAGGTEANNLAVLGAARARRAHGRHVLFGPAEHSCVREAALALGREGFEVEELRSDASGGLDLDALEASLRGDTVLVAVMLACNEHGAVYPVRRVAALARARSPHAHVHTDAVQAFGKLDADRVGLGVDSLAISAHKVHGPKGSGALVLGDGVTVEPLLFGGGQEGGARSGTENVAGIVGLARAAELADERREDLVRHLTLLRERVRERCAGIDGAALLEPGDRVLPSIAAVRLPGPPAEVYQHHLEERGVFVGVGSACQSNKREASPALRSLGLDAAGAKQVIRFSFSHGTELADVDAGLDAVTELAVRLAASAT